MADPAASGDIQSVVLETVRKHSSTNVLGVLANASIHAFYSVLRQTAWKSFLETWDASEGNPDYVRKNVQMIAGWSDPIRDEELRRVRKALSDRRLDEAQLWKLLTDRFLNEIAMTHPKRPKPSSAGGAAKAPRMRVWVDNFGEFYRRFMQSFAENEVVLSGSIFRQSVVDVEILFQQALALALTRSASIREFIVDAPEPKTAPAPAHAPVPAAPVPAAPAPARESRFHTPSHDSRSSRHPPTLAASRSQSPSRHSDNDDNRGSDEGSGSASASESSGSDGESSSGSDSEPEIRPEDSASQMVHHSFRHPEPRSGKSVVSAAGSVMSSASRGRVVSQPKLEPLHMRD
jgi:hypothetical protein